MLPLAWWLMIVTFVAFRLTPKGHWPAELPAAVLGVAWVAVFFVLLPSLVLFAAPQALVPPAVRDRPGAVAEWRAARRARRPAR